MISQDVLVRSLPQQAIETESKHRYGLDLKLQLSRRNTTAAESDQRIDKANVIPESAFLKLLRTEFKKMS